MCRIYGFFGPQLGTGDLTAAAQAQLHGGPDDQRHVLGRNWGLGCNRLAIQDPSSGLQPFSNAEQTVHLVFNGEIYNFRAIREELAREGVRVDGDSDGSVLVPCYERYGDSFAERLDGMYAIALVDLRHEPQLKLLCDTLSIKSLFYAEVGGGVAFSSELPGLTALTGATFDINPFAVDSYMDGQCLPGGSSWFTGAAALRPGAQLCFDGRQVIERLRLDTPALPGNGQQPDGAGVTRDDDAGSLRRLLRREVGSMCLQDAPVAVQLSGGLDSSILATLLRERREDVTAFHVVHEGSHPSDEEVFARDAAQRAGVHLEVVEVRADDVPDLLPEMVAALGSPNATPHALSAYVLFREIARNGFRVCFVGDGADEQFGGYRRYSDALAADDDAWAANYLDRLSLVPEARYRALYTAEYRAMLDASTSSRARAVQLLATPAPSRLEQVLMYDRLHKLPALNLRKLDHLSMAHAVEARVPYCQPAVTRLARALPDRLKVNGDTRKPVLWDIGRELIPASVQAREKQPFTFPVAAFMAAGTKLTQFTMEVLARPRLCSDGYLDPRSLAAVIARHRAGADQSGLLWGLMILELSLRAAVAAGAGGARA